MPTRRTVLRGAGALGALLASHVHGKIRGTIDDGGPDLDDPETNLRAFVKLVGSLDGKPVFDMVRGSVYGLSPGRAAQPLFRTVGAGVSVYSQTSALEYRSVSRYVGLLLDWETGQPLGRWTNPYTGEACEVPVTRYGPGEARIFSDRMLPAGTPDEPTTGTRPWYRLGDVVHIRREVFPEAPERPLFPKADLMTYSGDWELLADPKILRMPSRLNFSAVETWRDWMGMDGQPAGTLWWHVAGAKLAGADDYPAEVREWLLREDPSFFDAAS